MPPPSLSPLQTSTRHDRGRHRVGVLTAAAALVLLATVPAAGAPAERSTSPVLTIPPPGPPSVVGTSTLVRTDRGVSATVDTSALVPGDVATLWWIVVNDPAACEHPFAGSPCGPEDVPNPSTQASVLHGAGRIVGGEGTVQYGAHLRTGSTSRALLGPGLMNPRGAVVVLVVKTHGPRIPELTAEMLRTFAGGCADQSDVPPGAPERLVGTPGPNDCAEIQFTVHVPEGEG